MSVLIWRSRVSSMGSIGSLIGPLAMTSSLIVILGAGLAGCAGQAKKQNFLFDPGNRTPAEWQKIRADCRFEAAKAAVGSHKIVASEEGRKLYVLCVESKGIKFLGIEDA